MLGLETQILSATVMFLTGVVLALFYDLCAVVAGHTGVPRPARARRRERGPGGRVIRLWDLVYCLLVTPIIFAATMVSTRGELRLYVLVGLALGVAAYFILAASFVVTVTSAVRAAIIGGVVAAAHWVARPLLAAAARLGRAGHGLAAVGRRLAGGFGRGATGLSVAATAVLRDLRRFAVRLVAGIPRRPKE